MSEYILKLQKNIFLITAAAAAVLGMSLAYLAATGLRFALIGPQSRMAGDSAPRMGDRSGPATLTFRSLDEYLGIPTGGFFRGSGETAAGQGPDAGAPPAGEITLVGTLAGSPDFARALILETGQSDPQSYKRGQTVAGFKLVAIGRDHIVVDQGGRRLRIKVGEKSGEARANEPAPAEGAAAGGGSVQKIVIQRARLLEMLRDQRAIMENKFQPVIRDNKILGLKLIYVPPNNFLYQIGARNQDIIRRYNGQPLENQNKLIEIWQNLQTANNATVEVERSGRIISFEITIQ